MDLPDLVTGSYIIRVRAAGFEPLQLKMDWPLLDPHAKELRLEVGGIVSEVTVTALRGSAENAIEAAPFVSVRSGSELRERPLPTIGHGSRTRRVCCFSGVRARRFRPSFAVLSVIMCSILWMASG